MNNRLVVGYAEILGKSFALVTAIFNTVHHLAWVVLA